MSFAIQGYEIVENIISHENVEDIKTELNNIPASELRAGIRNADKKFISINKLVNSPILRSQAAHYLGSPANIVRVILFDKTAENNWLVSWHQDKTISVSGKCDIKNWGPWSIKDGAHHVQPPIDVLNKIVTIRIHIDDSTVENGCLRVIPRSHSCGILSASQIHEITRTHSAVNCIGTAGSTLIMKPHLLHASSKAKIPTQRRIIHVEYTSYNLPQDLNWA